MAVTADRPLDDDTFAQYAYWHRTRLASPSASCTMRIGMTTTVSCGTGVLHHVQHWIAGDLIDWHVVGTPHELPCNLWLVTSEAWIRSTFLTGEDQGDAGVPLVEEAGILRSVLSGNHADRSGQPSAQLDFRHAGGLAMTRHAVIDEAGMVRWAKSMPMKPSLRLCGNLDDLLPFALGLLPLAGVGGQVDVSGDFFELGFLTQSLEAQPVSAVDRWLLAAYLHFSVVLAATDETEFTRRIP